MPAPDLDLTFPWPPSTSHIYVRRSLKNGGVGMMLTSVAKQYRENVRAAASAAMREARRQITSGRIVVTIDLHPPSRRRFDIDNRHKLILDGMQGVVYHDDAQIVRMVTTKHDYDGRKGGNVLAWVYFPDEDD